MQIKQKMPLIFGVPDAAFFDGLESKMVFVAELRPGLDGMTIVSKELLKRNIVPVVICDNMMAFCMRQGLVSNVNIFSSGFSKGKAICRAGSLIAALVGKMHNVPVFLSKGKKIKGKKGDLLKIAGKRVTSGNIKTYVPVTEEVSLELVSTNTTTGM